MIELKWTQSNQGLVVCVKDLHKRLNTNIDFKEWITAMFYKIEISVTPKELEDIVANEETYISFDMGREIINHQIGEQNILLTSYLYELTRIEIEYENIR